jgi:hypothetical protein
MYLFRAVDSRGETVDFYLSETRDREAVKAFLVQALSNPDNQPPRVFCMDGNRSYPAAIRDLQAEDKLHWHCWYRTRRYANNRIESDHQQVKAAAARDAGAAHVPDSMPSDSGRRGCTDDPKGTGPGDHANKSQRSGNGLRISLRHRVVADDQSFAPP